MKNYSTQLACAKAILLAVLLCLAGCEAHELPLPEGNIRMLDTIYARGLKGYSIDSIYSEFVFDRSAKNVILKGLHKGVVSGSGDVTLKTDGAVIRYGEGSGDIVYSYGGILTEIVLNENYFAENVTTYEYGRLQSKIDYGYNASGYLSTARIERPGQVPVTVYYKYPDMQNPASTAEILIEEHPGPTVYHIPLATVNSTGEPAKQENEAYVCNVLRYGKSPITNEYVINPDLYYLGLYGAPFKYLPDEMIEKNIRQTVVTILRVGNGRYYY
ncbi:MAG: hypothetical protein LBS42_00030 [Tannerella sp.]|nr:hypothetical protein [Tannerella sp.]